VAGLAKLFVSNGSIVVSKAGIQRLRAAFVPE